MSVVPNLLSELIWKESQQKTTILFAHHDVDGWTKKNLDDSFKIIILEKCDNAVFTILYESNLRVSKETKI